MVSCSSVQKQTHQTPRHPSSIRSQNCAISLRNILHSDVKTNSYRQLVRALTNRRHQVSFVNNIAAQTESIKLEKLKNLNRMRGRDKRLNRNFIEIINLGLRTHKIKVSEIIEVLRDGRRYTLPLNFMFTGIPNLSITAQSEKLLYGSRQFLEDIIASHPVGFNDDEMKWLLDHFFILSQEEILLVSKYFSKDKEKMRLMKEYIKYTRTIATPNNRLNALSIIDELLDENHQHSIVSRFVNQKTRFKEFKSKTKQKFLTEKLQDIRQSGKSLNPNEMRQLQKEADEYAEKAMKTHRNLWYSCRNITTNEIQQKANYTYGKFILLISPVSTTINYAIFNDIDEIHTDAYLRGLAYDIVTQTLFNYIFARWINSPGDNTKRKIFKYLGLIGTSDSALMAGLYHPWIEERDHEKVEMLLNHPQFKQRLDILLENFEKTDYSEKFLQELTDVLYQDKETKEGEIKKLNVEDLKEIDQMDFNHQEIRNLFLQLMAEQSAKENEKYPLNYFEDEAYNRIAYHRFPYDVAGIGLDIYFNALIFNQLCSPVDQANSVARAAALFITYRLIDDFIYYGGRDLLINQ